MIFVLLKALNLQEGGVGRIGKGLVMSQSKGVSSYKDKRFIVYHTSLLMNTH